MIATACLPPAAGLSTVRSWSGPRAATGPDAPGKTFVACLTMGFSWFTALPVLCPGMRGEPRHHQVFVNGTRHCADLQDVFALMGEQLNFGLSCDRPKPKPAGGVGGSRAPMQVNRGVQVAPTIDDPALDRAPVTQDAMPAFEKHLCKASEGAWLVRVYLHCA